MKKLVKRYNPIGLGPGTLTEHSISDQTEAHISVIEFNEQEIMERQAFGISDCKISLQDFTTTWIQIKGTPSTKLLEDIGQLLKLHPLALEDINNSGQRPKYNEFDGTFLVIFTLPTMDNNQLSLEQISFVFRDNFIVSFCGKNDPFSPIAKRLNKTGTRIRKSGVDYLLYCLLDLLIDSAFPLLENIGGQLDVIEEEIILNPSPNVAAKLHSLKRDLIILRQIFWPQRDVLSRLIQDHEILFKESTKQYLNDCYEHSIQILDLVESFREITSSMLDVYLSSMSNRLNEVMKVLTIIATIFIPLTFITGIYGMNFSSVSNSPFAMPELNLYYGYPIVLGIMAAIATGMICYFKRKNWF
jgi:magnesium transporter